MSRNVVRLPKARRFAVAQMDPVEMVKHLNDSDAVVAAQEMQTQKYLVYLEYPEDLPLPDSQWCRYRVNPVATSLRPAVPEKGITQDMVIPIHPNEGYTRSDTLISPKPSFPFDNCYFWIDSRTSLRVRLNRERTYDNDKAFQLDIPQHIALSNGFAKEFSRMRHALTNVRHSSVNPGTRPTSSLAALSHPYAGSESALTDDADVTSAADSDSSTDSDSSSTSLEDLFELDLFGWHDDLSFQYIPLVDLWLDIDNHLCSSKIPNPVDLRREQRDITQIINRSLERRKDADRQRSLRLITPTVYEETHMRFDSLTWHISGFSSDMNDVRQEIRTSSLDDGAVDHLDRRMRHIGASRIVITSQHRSWSGDIHSQTRQTLACPQREAAVPSSGSKPPTRVEDDWNDRASVSTLPRYTPHATVPRYTPHAPHARSPISAPRSPPPLYSDLLKNAGLPAPPPRPSSKGAVWHSKRPPSVELTPSPPLRHRKPAVRTRPPPQVKSRNLPILPQPHPRDDGRPKPLPYARSYTEAYARSYREAVPRGRQPRVDSVLPVVALPVVEEVLDVPESVGLLAIERQRMALHHWRKHGRHSGDSPATLGSSRASASKAAPARGDRPSARPGALSRGGGPPRGRR